MRVAVSEEVIRSDSLQSSPIGDLTMVIPPPFIYRNSLTVPPNPFFISDSVVGYCDEPPSYSEVVDRGVSPIPCQPKVVPPEI
ncbi:unnamed protein product [Caenorhabditis sp. 36 PRJEB53466]|nr:unnamed protein product [Caenorhabditis sp. 36 PRJEB53466]